MQILDVRSLEEWKKGHIPGAEHIFLPELAEQFSRLDQDRPVAVYCDSGYRASLGASLLKAQGFAEVHNVPGSWQAWEALDYPVDHPAAEEKAAHTKRNSHRPARAKAVAR
jgi:hydroxyacylglutathione hydrolase